jgi:hypothetical protein
MKVLEKGNPQKGWTTKVKCTGHGNQGGGCGAVLQVEEPDLFLTSSSVRDETDYYVSFQCCECGVLTDLPTAKVPSRFMYGSGKLPSYVDWKKKQNEEPHDG